MTKPEVRKELGKGNTTLKADIGPQLQDQLDRYGQRHLLAFWDQLDEPGRSRLMAQLTRIDFAAIDRLVRDGAAQEDWHSLAARAEPPPAIRRDQLTERARDRARETGRGAIAEGHVGVLLVAGGQGTRLGFHHPKGMVAIGPVSDASLFQIHIEKVVAAARRNRASVPLYVMTSPATHDETVRFFADHDRFGLSKDDLQIFCQGTMPAADAATGRLLMDAPDRLCLSPDGHGGVVSALGNSGAIADMEQRGLRHIFYFQVDNALAPVCDPESIGFHIGAAADVSMLAVPKRTPKDHVGNVVTVDGKPRIIEYIDLPDEVAAQRREDGSLRLWAGSIGIHVFDAPFLARMTARGDDLPFHVSRKRVPHIDQRGVRIEPGAPNGLKFERFVFDLLPEAQTAQVIEVDRAKVFAPLKNAEHEKENTIFTVRRQMVALHRRWLETAGAEVDEDVAVEISPLFANRADDLAGRIEPGSRITEPTYFVGRGDV